KKTDYEGMHSVVGEEMSIREREYGEDYEVRGKVGDEKDMLVEDRDDFYKDIERNTNINF
uniref:hypothetical protein n=1 Tax=Bacillus sp. S1-R4H1-FB TaxID=1973492 RepID=UPI001C54BFEF